MSGGGVSSTTDPVLPNVRLDLLERPDQGVSKAVEISSH